MLFNCIFSSSYKNFKLSKGNFLINSNSDTLLINQSKPNRLLHMTFNHKMKNEYCELINLVN